MNISEIEVSYHPRKLTDTSIGNSVDAYKIFYQLWNKGTMELREDFYVMLLNRANKAIGIFHLSKGGITATVVDIKLLFGVVLKTAAQSIILAHNHPSGNLKPSEADKELTRKIKEASTLLEITVLDHLILTKDGFYSFADDGLL
ncbi:MAG: JAB domain-containing protein [Saprospiraceae bacterium]